MQKKKYDKRLLWGVALFSILQFGILLYKNQEANLSKIIKRETLDTFVPLGFTLIPIQIENKMELDSLIDRFAIVDLHKKGINEVIASGVRLLRSPNNPDVFAVLIEQNRAREIISEHGAQFTVSLKSPDSKPSPIKPKRTITLE